MNDPAPLRLYFSRRTRRRFIAATMILFAAAVLNWVGSVATERPTLSSLGWFLAGVGAVAFVFALFGRTERDECAFCLRRRAAVTLLVAGPSVSICDGCVGLPMGIVAEELERRREPQNWHRRFLEGLPRQCPIRVSSPLLHLSAEADSTNENIRSLVPEAFRLGNYSMVRDLLQRIPEIERRAEDWINLGVAFGSLGMYRAAVESTLHAESKGEAHRPWLLNNSAWFRVREKDLSAGEVTELLQRLEEAKATVRKQAPSGWESVLANFMGTEAELKRALGDFNGSERALAEAEKLGGMTPERLLIRARVAIESKRFDDARHDLQRAIEEAHPESLVAAQAREGLARIDATATQAPS
jgi:hypothetical protein